MPRQSTAHPRSRGENVSSETEKSTCPGSSPLTRGKPSHSRRERCGGRLIPAHAGKTWCSTGGLSGWWAHPRSRRENLIAPEMIDTSAGSSPLTRGKLDAVEELVSERRLIPAHAGKTTGRMCLVPHVVRLIPAHAGKTSGQPSTRHPRAAHPRSRGENDGSRLALRRIVGSSPLTRGKRRSCHRVSWRGGLIPAHAGKTRHASMRFEVVAGSSPLTRGKPPRALAYPRRDGLIPAHAGKTAQVCVGHFRCPAHPRSRGENTTESARSQARRGSSPLTRGKHDGPHRGIRRVRLIPAHAGKTLWGRFPPPVPPAHPRSRGENPTYMGALTVAPGSSPLTRGKPDLAARRGSSPRLIPAHAGKTLHPDARRPAQQAHPRSRGENPGRLAIHDTAVGSSPLTRGKLLPQIGPALEGRLIPAHAGKTLGNNWLTCQLRAHPRSRGENEVSKDADIDVEGSSPLTRGKLREEAALRAGGGLIPAHAGKTGRRESII